jgi:hypothetical protein
MLMLFFLTNLKNIHPALIHDPKNRSINTGLPLTRLKGITVTKTPAALSLSPNSPSSGSTAQTSTRLFFINPAANLYVLIGIPVLNDGSEQNTQIFFFMA